MSQASAHTAGMSDINITPLIDVMLVVLVIFMIAVPAITRTIRADLPGITGEEPIPTKPLLLRIDDNGSYSLDGRPITPASLAGLLGNTVATAQDKPPVLKVQAGDYVRYETVAQALADARNAGIERIAMVR